MSHNMATESRLNRKKKPLPFREYVKRKDITDLEAFIYSNGKCGGWKIPDHIPSFLKYTTRQHAIHLLSKVYPDRYHSKFKDSDFIDDDEKLDREPKQQANQDHYLLDACLFLCGSATDNKSSVPAELPSPPQPAKENVKLSINEVVSIDETNYIFLSPLSESRVELDGHSFIVKGRVPECPDACSDFVFSTWRKSCDLYLEFGCGVFKTILQDQSNEIAYVEEFLEPVVPQPIVTIELSPFQYAEFSSGPRVRHALISDSITIYVEKVFPFVVVVTIHFLLSLHFMRNRMWDVSNTPCLVFLATKGAPLFGFS